MRTLLALLLLVVGAAHAASAEPFKKQDLIGAWAYTSATTRLSDGSEVYQFGENPKGIFIILPNGIYSHIVMRDNLPKVKTGRLQDTEPQERERIAEGVLAHFGTYTVNEKDGTFTVHIDRSSFSNFNGLYQTRIVTKLTKDKLEYVNKISSRGAGAVVISKLTRVY